MFDIAAVEAATEAISHKPILTESATSQRMKSALRENEDFPYKLEYQPRASVRL
jgi:hypothetical protein